MAQAGYIAKGNVSLTIDELGLEAIFSFSPDTNGADWNGEKLRQLLLEHKVSQGFNAKDLEDLIQRCAKSKGPLTEVIAKGQAPEQPHPETLDLGEIPLPEEIKSLAFDLIAHSPPPEIFNIRVEKVRRESVVMKPGALPFLPKKKETVVTFDKRETREAINVDTQVLLSGYAHTGSKIGTLFPGKPGKPGKSIFGRPITVDISQDRGFYLGNFLEKGEKASVIARKTGIVRIGKNWADILPFADHAWTLSLSPDQATLLLRYEPGDPKLPAPKGAMILERAVALGGNAELMKDAATIDLMISRAIATRSPIYDEPLSIDKNAEAIVDVSPDGLKATLSLRKGRGKGAPLTLAVVSAALKANPVKGINLEKLKADINAFLSGAQSSLQDYPLAAGRDATRGKDRTLQFNVTFLPEEQARSIIQGLKPLGAKGLSDKILFEPTTAQKLAYVKESQVVATLGPKQMGSPGIDVRGKEIPGLPGNDPDLGFCDSLRANQGKLLSACTGVFLYKQEGTRILLCALPHRDAKIDVKITQDAMTAYLTLEREEGSGSPLSVEKILEEVAARGIRKGVDTGIIGEAIKRALGGTKVENILFAKGKKPRSCGGAKLVPALAETLESGRSYRVKAGELIATVESSGIAEEGYDLLGAVLAPETAESRNALRHDGSLREEKSGTLVKWIAAASGELHLVDDQLAIGSSKIVTGDVSPATGNIKYEGSIGITGSVRKGAMVVATGDIKVKGSMECALLSSEAGVIVAQGFFGSGKGIIRAKRGIALGSSDQATLMAVEDIQIMGTCVSSQIKTNGKVLLIGDRGILVGGSCRAKKGVECQCLGSEKGIRTELSFGQDYLVADQIETEQREIEKLKAAIVQYDAKMKELERSGQAGPSLDAVRQEKLKVLKFMEKRSLRMFTLREKFEEHFPSEISVRGYIYPGVVLESHGRYLEIETRKQQVAFTFDLANGKIQERPLN